MQRMQIALSKFNKEKRDAALVDCGAEKPLSRGKAEWSGGFAGDQAIELDRSVLSQPNAAANAVD